MRLNRIQEANSKKKGPKKHAFSSSKQKNAFKPQECYPAQTHSPISVPKSAPMQSKPDPPPPPPTKLYNTDLAEALQDLRMDNQPPSRFMNNRRGKGQGRRRGKDDETDMPSRPSKGSTLFDFLESHLPPSKEKPETPSKPSSQITSNVSKGTSNQNFNPQHGREENRGGGTEYQYSRNSKSTFNYPENNRPSYHQPPPSRPKFQNRNAQSSGFSRSFHGHPPPFQTSSSGSGDFNKQRQTPSQPYRPPPDVPYNKSQSSWADCEYEENNPLPAPWSEKKTQPQLFTSMEFRSRRGGTSHR